MKRNRRRYPTQKRLKELFVYCPSGRLMWRKRIYRLSKNKGRKYTQVDGIIFYEHVLVFIYHQGFRPPVVDHKDRNPKNNKIENLQASTVSLNSRNRTQKKNKTGARGVYKEINPRSINKFRVTIYAGKTIHVGNFMTLKKAIKARQKAEIKYYGKAYL